MNVSNVELIKCCEKYFDEYICRYRKIKELRTIEYVNLAGVHRELWYKKSSAFYENICCTKHICYNILVCFSEYHISLFGGNWAYNSYLGIGYYI